MRHDKLNTHDFNVETKGRLPEVHRFEHLTELARKRGERDIEHANNNIRTEYRKRLHDTREMKSRMEHCVSTVGVEVGILERCRGELLEGLRGFEPNIALSAQWNALRRGRPGSPSMHHENVVRALSQNNEELKAAIGRLTAALVQLDDSLKELRGCQQSLGKEVNAKMATMIIDNACMEELINAADLLGPDHRLKPQSAIMQSSKLHTHNEWSNTAESVISNALAQIEVSQGRRKKALSVLRTTREAGRYNRSPLVLDALQTRLRYNQQQLASLELNISMLSGQIDQLDKQRASLGGSLEKIMQQQSIAQQRLDVRAMLPTKENTRPNVEATLEIEIFNLGRNERDLRAKLAELERSHHKQLQLRASMEAEHKSRSAAVALDKACLELRLPPVGGGASAGYQPSAALEAYASGGATLQAMNDAASGDGTASARSSGRNSGRSSSRRNTNSGGGGASHPPNGGPSPRDWEEASSGHGGYAPSSGRGGNVPQPPPNPKHRPVGGEDPYAYAESGRSYGRSSGRFGGGSSRAGNSNGDDAYAFANGGASARSTATGGGGGGGAVLPPIPSPPSPRGAAAGRYQTADVEALLKARTPTSVRSARTGSSRR